MSATAVCIPQASPRAHIYPAGCSCQIACMRGMGAGPCILRQPRTQPCAFSCKPASCVLVHTSALCSERAGHTEGPASVIAGGHVVLGDVLRLQIGHRQANKLVRAGQQVTRADLAQVPHQGKGALPHIRRRVLRRTIAGQRVPHAKPERQPWFKAHLSFPHAPETAAAVA